MELNPVNSKKIKSLFFPMIFGMVITAIFISILRGISINSILAGLCIGGSIAVLFLSLKVFLFDTYFRKLNLFIVLIIEIFLMICIMVLCITFFAILFDLPKKGYTFSYSDIITFLQIKHFRIGMIFGTIAISIIVIVLLINALIGPDVLVSLIIGKYHQPKEEERIFMFLDIKSSTTIAEKTGHLKFLSFLNDFFYDITDAIIVSKGEIYKYVGDEIIITWTLKKGIKNENCLQCFFMMRNKIYKKKSMYLKKYGIIPEFKAGLHSGMVVVGEMGYFRKEIAFIGDVLNTTARIEGKCNDLKEDFLISEEIMRMIRVPENIRTRLIPNIKLRGKEKNIQLYALRFKKRPHIK